MNYEDLKAGIETAPLKSRVALEQLLLYTTMGGFKSARSFSSGSSIKTTVPSPMTLEYVFRKAR